MNDSVNQILSGLQTVAQREAALLAPYAMHSADSKGRQHSEATHSYRGPFQRDRDRILHSAAYRRLSGKMQVFTGEMGDYHRTRLTHTQEVASIARTIGRALRLNEDLIEAMALLHDLGHPPFGHAGEDALDQCLAGEGGFSHNRQALVIVEQLEQRYPSFSGLNLSHEVLGGQTARVQKGESAESGSSGPLLETQVVDVADSITYDAHDTDDAVKLGLLTIEELAGAELGRDCIERVGRRFGRLDGKMQRTALVHQLIDRQVSDVLQTSGRLTQCGFDNQQHARQSEFRIGPSRELAEQKSELETLLYERVYRHPKLIEMRAAAQQRLRAMFEGYVARPDLLPKKFQIRAGAVGIARSVSDYIAGMTDRFCDQQYQRYFAGDGGG